jgi:type II secretory pathway pseudopilin PulG
MSRLRRATTLVEVLVVVGLLAVLIGLLLPAVQRARTAGERTGGLNQLRQINLALQSHIAGHGNRLPHGDRRLY